MTEGSGPRFLSVLLLLALVPDHGPLGAAVAIATGALTASVSASLLLGRPLRTQTASA